MTITILNVFFVGVASMTSEDMPATRKASQSVDAQACFFLASFSPEFTRCSDARQRRIALEASARRKASVRNRFWTWRLAIWMPPGRGCLARRWASCSIARACLLPTAARPPRPSAGMPPPPPMVAVVRPLHTCSGRRRPYVLVPRLHACGLMMPGPCPATRCGTCVPRYRWWGSWDVTTGRSIWPRPGTRSLPSSKPRPR